MHFVIFFFTTVPEHVFHQEENSYRHKPGAAKQSLPNTGAQRSKKKEEHWKNAHRNKKTQR